MIASIPALVQLFLSTPSARRATYGVCFKIGETGDFYPRPPRGGRLHRVLVLGQLADISIHALREEGDSYRSWHRPAQLRFLSTPSARRATPFVTGRSTVLMLFLSTPSARRATAAEE